MRGELANGLTTSGAAASGAAASSEPGAPEPGGVGPLGVVAGWFGFGRETRGERLRFRVFELFLLAHAVYWAWDWGMFIRRIPRVVVPQGIARDIDLSFLVGSPLALVNAACISSCAVGALSARWARWCVPALVALLHVQYVARHCLGKVAHGSQYVGLGLLCLALAAWCMPAPSARRRFALGATQLLMGGGYVLAAASKLWARGLAWPDGRHLWLWIGEKNVDLLSELGRAEPNALQRLCLEHWWLATALLGLGLASELCGFLLWFPATRTPITLALIGLHVGIFWSLGILFGSYMGLLVIVCLPWPALVERARGAWASRRGRRVGWLDTNAPGES